VHYCVDPQLKKYFTFEVQVLDDKNVRRRFRASNYQSTTRVKPFICTMPMRLDEGWNQIQFNLSDFTRRAYGTNYIETLRVQIHANCRIRRCVPISQIHLFLHSSCNPSTCISVLSVSYPLVFVYLTCKATFVMSDHRARRRVVCIVLCVYPHNRIYFSDRLYSEEELPAEFKLFLPIQKQ
jgi:hypothetical protein